MRFDLESKTPAGLPLTVGVEMDQLVIRIGVDTLADKANDFRRSWKVTDKYKFAKGVANGLCVEEEDGSTPLIRVLEAALIRVLEAACIDDGRIVTDEMLHPQD